MNQLNSLIIEGNITRKPEEKVTAIVNRDTELKYKDANTKVIYIDVNGINTQVERQSGDIDSLYGHVSSIQQTADSISIQVKDIIDNGVDKVTTGTGYTFKDDGLRIRKTGEEIENKLDHTGMYVTRSGEIMLKADKDGVVATDVTVRNYLIIGSHARFEDYSDGTDGNRTACFYV